MKHRRPLEPSALQLVEEAVHLLRRAPAATLVIYYAGAAPFALGILFFCAHAAWFRPDGAEVAWGALALVALFLALKALQVEFCARLLAARLGAAAPAWSWRRLGCVGLAQLRLQSWTMLLTLGAALVAVPFGWVYAYGQNLTVVGEGERMHDEAVAQARLWPAQNHLGLAIIAGVALATWVNFAAAFQLVPYLANRLLGIENIFGFSGWWFFNTTFLLSVTALTWLAVDPLVKAFYVLRVFHGRARRTGDDLRVDLELARRATGRARVAATVAILLLLMAPGREARGAEESRPARAAVEPAALDRAIEGVLGGPEFRWRLRPPPGRETKSAEGPIKRFVRQGFEIVGEVFRMIGRLVRTIGEWFERVFGGGRSSAGASGGGVAVLQVFLYAIIAAAGLLLLWVVWLVMRSARRGATTVLAARALAAAAPDLSDEDVQAAQLPAEGWLTLAREQAARGEWRLALRALYLATLARLAADGLITLAKSKTNLDYEREVRRRALSRAEVAGAFAGRRRQFEAAWYGRAEPAAAEVRAWLAEMEGAMRKTPPADGPRLPA